MGKTRTALAAACILAFAAPAVADDFCDAVKRVVGDTLDGYAAIRGAPDPKYPASYWDPLLLPGAVPLTAGFSPCFVLHAARTVPPDQYRCYFPGRGTRDELLMDMHGMADRVGDCLGPMAWDPKAGVWQVDVSGVRVIVGGALAPAGSTAGTVAVMIEPAPPKKK